MIEVVKYETKHKSLWDEFISKSKNGIFLFYRDYMEYHSDRFTDFSIMFFDDSKLTAVMPANIESDMLLSHGGLTFGGVISDRKTKTPMMLKIFDSLTDHLKKQGIRKIVYKSIPYIYHDVPAEEDLYALFIHNARLFRRDVSSTICMQERIAFSKGRKWTVKKSKGSGLDVKRSHDFGTFMAIEKATLQQKYGINPTHTTDEIQLLASRFPENVKLFAAHKDETMLAGVIVYESKSVAHTQYIATTDEGKKEYAVDLMLDLLINEYYAEKKYFDFGISTEENGFHLNEGLIRFKEEFGARAVVHDFYEVDIV